MATNITLHTETQVTPLQALRRLVDIARLIDADECPELYNQLQGELTVAGAVLAEDAEPVASAAPVDDIGNELESQYFGKLLSRIAEFGFNGGHDENLIQHIKLWGHGQYIRGYDKRKAEEVTATNAVLTYEQAISVVIAAHKNVADVVRFFPEEGPNEEFSKCADYILRRHANKTSAQIILAAAGVKEVP